MDGEVAHGGMEGTGMVGAIGLKLKASVEVEVAEKNQSKL